MLQKNEVMRATTNEFHSDDSHCRPSLTRHGLGNRFEKLNHLPVTADEVIYHKWPLME